MWRSTAANARLRLVEPVRWADFIILVSGAMFAANEGTNALVGTDVANVARELEELRAGRGGRAGS